MTLFYLSQIFPRLLLLQLQLKIWFQGATMHGMNDIILSSGLAVDYNQVSSETENCAKA